MISVADLRAWLQLAADDTEDDALLEELEERAVALLGELVGDHYGAETEFAEVVDGSGTAELWLDRTPTSAAVTVELRAGQTWEVVDSELFMVTGRRVLRVDGSAWSRGSSAYRVTYTAGYAAGEEPALVYQAVLDIVRFFYREGRSYTLKELALPDVQTRSAGPQHIASVRELIARNKRPML